MQKVLLTIKGSQIEDPGSIVEFVTEGRLSKQSDGYLIEYDESDLTGSDGVTTSILLDSSSVTMSRNGEEDSQMVFLKDSVFQSNVSTPSGMMRMNILATNLKSDLGEKSGKVDLEYELSLGDVCSAGKLILSFKSIDDWIN
jgi:uncharacterized beta-barrel protein YwiB (DUF1934 family)